MLPPEKSTDELLNQSKNLPASNNEKEIGNLSQTHAGNEVSIFENQQRSFSLIRKEDGEEKIKILVRSLLAEVFDFYGKAQPDSVFGVVYGTIMSEYFYFKPDDIKLCFARGMAAHYGKVDFFNAGLIMDWLNLYSEERIKKAENHSAVKDVQKLKKEYGWDNMPPEIKDKFLELANNLEKKNLNPKYKDLKDFFQKTLNAPYEDNFEPDGIVATAIKGLENEWKRDFNNQGSKAEFLLTWDAYYKYRTKKELIRINNETIL